MARYKAVEGVGRDAVLSENFTDFDISQTFSSNYQIFREDYCGSGRL